jgi:hypothetical protein
MRPATAVIAFLLLATAASAQNVCPCIAKSDMWTVRTTDGFNAGMTALVTAHGDPLTFILPAGMQDQRWLVLQRVPTGSYIDDGTDPFRIEQFDGFTNATARMSAIDADHRPRFITAPDGSFLILSLRQPVTAKQRAVSR